MITLAHACWIAVWTPNTTAITSPSEGWGRPTISFYAHHIVNPLAFPATIPTRMKSTPSGIATSTLILTHSGCGGTQMLGKPSVATGVNFIWEAWNTAKYSLAHPTRSGGALSSTPWISLFHISQTFHHTTIPTNNSSLESGDFSFRKSVRGTRNSNHQITRRPWHSINTCTVVSSSFLQWQWIGTNVPSSQFHGMRKDIFTSSPNKHLNLRWNI